MQIFPQKRFVDQPKIVTATVSARCGSSRFKIIMAIKNDSKGQDSCLAEHTPNCRPASKWAAVLGDRLMQMPRRVVLAKDIKHEAGIGPDFALVRDYNSPNDTVFADDAEVDLAEGNVFRVIPACEATPTTPCREPAKLAFVVDDIWEITTNPNHTGKTLHRLFALPPEVKLFRDSRSPDDELIGDADKIRFADGPVFRTEGLVITVKVNNKEVKFTKRRVTGEEIKKTAAHQGATIPPGGILYKVTPKGLEKIADQDAVCLKECDEFRCVTPDDNS